MDKDILSALAEIDSVNPYASFLNESSLSNIDGFIDTGSMVLNAIISGSVYGGIPKGRLTQFAGPSSCLTKDQVLRVYEMRSVRRDV